MSPGTHRKGNGTGGEERGTSGTVTDVCEIVGYTDRELRFFKGAGGWDRDSEGRRENHQRIRRSVTEKLSHVKRNTRAPEAVRLRFGGSPDQPRDEFNNHPKAIF